MNLPINWRLPSLLALIWVSAPATIWWAIVPLEITLRPSFLFLIEFKMLWWIFVIKEELTWVFIMFTKESFTISISSVWILFARFTEPSVFRMVEVSPRIFDFPFAIDSWSTFCTSVRGFFLGNKFFSRFYGGLHFISLRNRSYVIICIFIFLIFNFNLWYTSKRFFCNVNIGAFLCRSFEIVDNWGHSSSRKGSRSWCLVSSGCQICLWAFIMTSTWCLRSSTRHFVFTETCVLFLF